MVFKRILLGLLIAAWGCFQPVGLPRVRAAAFISCDAQTEIPSEECGALVALYNSTGGPNWSYRTNWLETDAPGGWFGVSVSGGHVTGIALPSNQLWGPLPAQLGDLAYLETLDLSGYPLFPTPIRLTGSIPPELGKLTRLKTLDLSINNLSGSIPAEMGKLASLTRLDLDHNQLSGSIPPELGGLANLDQLILSANQLEGSIPPELGGLTKLSVLELSVNQLSGSIPPQLGSLANLQTLLLPLNRLSGNIPPELGELANLTVLDLSVNQLKGNLPPEFGGLANLKRLFLESNQFDGGIPMELGKLGKLTVLDLSTNQLTGTLPPELGNLASLETLYLWSNPLSGRIPLSLTGLTHLSYFWASDTRLCEPEEASFLAWKAGVVNWSTPGACYTVNGQVTRLGDPQAGALVSNGFSSTLSGVDGRYSLADLPSGGYTLTVSLSGHVFYPAAQSVTVQGASLNGQDFIDLVQRVFFPWAGGFLNTGIQ